MQTYRRHVTFEPTAIPAANVVGYRQLIADDETGTPAVRKAHRMALIKFKTPSDAAV